MRQPIGAEVEDGALLAVVSDPLGESETEIKSPMDGVIVGRTNLPLAHEGDALFHIGRTGRSRASGIVQALSPPVRVMWWGLN